jgi:RHS repeat-associated protein
MKYILTPSWKIYIKIGMFVILGTMSVHVTLGYCISSSCDGGYNPGGSTSPGGGGGSSGGGNTESPEAAEARAAQAELTAAQTMLQDVTGNSAAEIRAAEVRVAAAQQRVDAANAALGAPQGGDPVLLTSGRYIFEETDLEVPGSVFAFERVYVSEDHTSGNLGDGWTSSLDTRIIRGVTMPDEAALSQIKSKVDVLKQKAERTWVFSQAKATGEKIQEAAAQAQAQYDDLVAIRERGQTLHALNGKVLFPGTPDYYEDVGNEKLVVVDGRGNPVIFEPAGSGAWQPLDEKLRLNMKLESHDGGGADSTAGFTLYERGGVKRHYDGNGLLEAVGERNGERVTVSRDGDGKITKLTGLHQDEWVVSYGGRFIKTIAGPEGQEVRYGYENGYLREVTDTDGDTVRYVYSEGRLSRIVKPDGSFIALTYGYEKDGVKLVTATMHEEGGIERFDYYPSERRTVHVNHSGVATQYWYNENHKTVREVAADGTEKRYTYNVVGLIETETVNGLVTRYGYDGRGNVSEKRYGDGTRETWVWNGNDQVTRYTDRDGVETRWSYDGQGNCVSIIRAGETVFTARYTGGRLVESREGNRDAVQYGYDVRGYPASRTSSSGTERWTRDALGRITKYSDGGGRMWEYRYGKNRQTVIGPLGLHTIYTFNSRKDLISILEEDTATGEQREQRAEYDKRHLAVEITDGAGTVTAYVYREDGLLVRKEAGSWVWEYGYDAGGRLTAVRRGKDGSAETYTETYGFRKEGWEEERSVSVQDGGTTMYRIDGNGRVTAVTNALGETSTRSMSGAGRVTKEQGGSGGFYTYRYDGSGRLVETGREGEQAVRVRYNRDGSITEKMDREGNVTRYEYNGRGLVSREVTSLGEQRYWYDGAGRVTRQETATKGTVYVTEWAYNDGGRTVAVSEGGRYTSTWKLNAWGETVSITDGEGNGSHITYNGAGQLVKTTDGYGKETIYEWNELGKVSKVTGRDGSTETYEYNHLGQTTKITDALGTVWEGVYDGAGRLVRENGRPGIDKEYKYDALGRVTEVKSGGEVTARYRYGSRGREVVFSDGNGETYQINRNAYGEAVEETNRLGGKQRYRYDKEGRLSETTAFSGKQVRVAYQDGQGITTETYGDGTTAVIERDMLGNVIRVTGETGTIRYKYDAGRRLIEQTDAGAGEVTRYEYDHAGRRTRMASGNRDVRYGYGKNGELLWVRDAGQRLEVKYEYDAAGRETRRTYGNGVVQESVYDKAGRLILITETNATRQLLRAEGYVYDTKGRRSHSVDDAGKVTKYEYDNQSRLKTVLYPWSEAKALKDKQEAEEAGLYFTPNKGTVERYTLTGNEAAALRTVLNLAGPMRGNGISVGQIVWRESYTYDGNGNRASKTTPWGTIAYAYDAENRLVSKGSIQYIHDADGNLVSEQGLRKEAEYRYNGRNRIEYAEVTDVASREQAESRYRYDGLGRRTLAQNEDGEVLRTLYDGMSFEVIREGPSYTDGQLTTRSAAGPVQTAIPQTTTTPSNTATGERYRWISDGQEGRTRSTETATQSRAGRYEGINVTLYGKGEAVGLSRSAGTRSGITYLGKDILGSVRSATGETGSLEERYEYDAFGTPYKGDLENGMNLGYTGKPYDAKTGLYNYGYRDYQPAMARFTTVDPIRDGTNWFAYVHNNPVSYIDILGLWEFNGDGTATAQPGDTLSGLAAELTGSGSGWERYEFAGDPLKTIDPKTLQVGTVINVDNIVGFSNADQAAMNIMPKINPTSQAQEVEYGGFTYEQDGTTYYTRPATDNSKNTWDPKNHGVSPDTPGASQYTLDLDQIVSGWYHTHPFVPNPITGQNEYDSEHFSGWERDPEPNSRTGYGGDMHLSDVTGIPAYVITPTDLMWKYTPVPDAHLPYATMSAPFSSPSSVLGTISPLPAFGKGR